MFIDDWDVDGAILVRRDGIIGNGRGTTLDRSGIGTVVGDMLSRRTSCLIVLRIMKRLCFCR